LDEARRESGLRAGVGDADQTGEIEDQGDAVSAQHLKRLGFMVDIVSDGNEALVAIAQTAYDVVLMDCQMPGLDGFATTREIRIREAAGSLPRLPIVAMTAGAAEGDREACFDCGMDDYVSKPVRWDALPALLQRHLVSYRLATT